MSAHIVVDINGGFTAVARVVARLHSLAVNVEELHAAQNRLCVHLHDAADVRRVSTVLARLVDVDLPPRTYAPGRPACAALGNAVDVRTTTYVVWSETLREATVEAATPAAYRAQAQPRIVARHKLPT